jgi:hypothetical protein
VALRPPRQLTARFWSTQKALTQNPFYDLAGTALRKLVIRRGVERCGWRTATSSSMMKTTASCELRGNPASMAFFPADAARCARAAPMLFLAPLLTMLIPSAARLAMSDRWLRAKPGVERRLEGSWSDGVIIAGPARCLLDGFDPAGTPLLFSYRNRISGRFAPIRGELGVWPFRALRRAALGVRSECGSIRFLLLSEGFGANRVSPHSTTALGA